MKDTETAALALFKPRTSRQELKGDATTRAARQIIDGEASARVAKTARLKAQRLAREALEQPAAPATRKRARSAAAAGR